MGNVTKLLNKPLKTFIVFTCLVLAGSVPAYFYLVESIWMDELDDQSQHLKEQIHAHFNEATEEELNKKIALWNQLQTNSQILPASRIHNDSTYFIEKEIMDDGVIEMERFRGLSSIIYLNNKPYTITIETNVEDIYETVFAISVVTCLFILLLIIGFTLLNRRLSKRIWAPFTDTLSKLKQFDLNSTRTMDLTSTNIQEFMELNEALTKLIDNNVQAYKQQQEFTQNASHELQTPLALLKTKIDLLIQDISLTTKQRETIELLDNAVSRMTRINKNLLLLAGIENRQYETEEVDLSEMVKSLIVIFGDFAENKACAISTSIQNGVMKYVNESLAEILISNLLSNAIRHGLRKSAIAVVLTDQALTISNEGKSPLNEGNLFKRFASVNADNPGSGLGLAILKEICDKYGWRITYFFTENQHIFSIVF
jgi:signal transduction histidine kinase